MITVIKLNTRGEEKIRYSGEIIQRLLQEVIIKAVWTLPPKQLEYTVFEPHDQFIEYYYTDRWFNIFDISNETGIRKGWYCNIAEPAHIFVDRIEQVDLLIDVWVEPNGNILILDEDEFAADMTLTIEQRNGAKQGVQSLLQMIAHRQEAFSSLWDNYA